MQVDVSDLITAIVDRNPVAFALTPGEIGGVEQDAAYANAVRKPSSAASRQDQSLLKRTAMSEPTSAVPAKKSLLSSAKDLGKSLYSKVATVAPDALKKADAYLASTGTNVNMNRATELAKGGNATGMLMIAQGLGAAGIPLTDLALAHGSNEVFKQLVAEHNRVFNEVYGAIDKAQSMPALALSASDAGRISLAKDVGNGVRHLLGLSTVEDLHEAHAYLRMFLAMDESSVEVLGGILGMPRRRAAAF